jgi:hypothetical protein
MDTQLVNSLAQIILSLLSHHVHLGDEFIVKSSESRNILQILTLIEQEIQNQ